MAEINEEQIIKTTLRIPESVHRTLKAACALSGENLSEFVSRTAKAELERLVELIDKERRIKNDMEA